MDDLWTRMWNEIAARPDGPLALRFYLQPLIATAFAIRDGVRDAHADRPAYFWSLLTDPEHRAERLRSGWKSVGKIFLIASVLDLVYQLVVLKGVRPVQTLVVAVLLALVPYLIVRGPVNRIVHARMKPAAHSRAPR